MKTKQSVILAVLWVLLCSGTAFAADLTGMWDVNVTFRGAKPIPSQVLITQTGNTFTYESPLARFQGTIEGDKYVITGPFPGRADLGRVWVEYERIEIQVTDENKIKGVVTVAVFKNSKATEKMTASAGKLLGYRIKDPLPRVIAKGGVETWVKTGAVFEDPGVRAHDGAGKDLTEKVESKSTVDTSKPGDYTVTYNVTDDQGKKAPELVRTVHVVNPGPPIIKIRGDENTSVSKGTLYADLGATAVNYLHHDISDKVKVMVNGKEADPSSPAVINTQTAEASYKVSYMVEDENGKTEAVRTVVVAGSEDEQSFWSYCFISSLLPGL
jgi:hypothetical protein